MTSVWLDIPLADYEGHMALPAVGQAQLIARLFGELIRTRRPSSVALMGCAGGNGFEHLIGSAAERIEGVDINERYLEKARERNGSALPGLALHAADIQCDAAIFDPVDLIYAALVLEYVDLGAAIRTLRRHCRAGGTLATLIQLPHRSQGHVSASPYTSLGRLGPAMRLVSGDDLIREAAGAGFRLEEAKTYATAAGKEFALHRFTAAPGTATK